MGWGDLGGNASVSHFIDVAYSGRSILYSESKSDRSYDDQ